MNMRTWQQLPEPETDGPPEKSREGDVHVAPQFGKAHRESDACWCRPQIDVETLRYAVRVWVHNPAQ